MPYPSSAPRRGEIYWVDWTPARGSEQAGRRPAVVISLDSFNQAMPVVVIAALTTKIKPMRIVVDLPAGDPLKEQGQILPFQVSTIDKSRLDGYMGILSAIQVKDLEDKLRLCWGL